MRRSCYETDVARIRRWKCGAVEIVRVVSKFGLPTRWLVVERLPSGNERIVSRHRKERAARRRAARLQMAN